MICLSRRRSNHPLTHRRSRVRPTSSLSYPLLRDKSDLEQIDYGRLERDGDAEGHQVRGDEIAQVQDQLEKQTNTPVRYPVPSAGRLASPSLKRSSLRFGRNRNLCGAHSRDRSF